jgi:TolB-like protein/DNA-binding winged helix-turn-helix (wHTH) protein/Tfp pilus assembly protein PilF
MKEEPSCFYEFGPFRLDPAKRVLWRGSEPVPLTGRAFDTLLVLIQSAGKTVEKDQIIEAVWRGAAVEENNLTQCISALRKTLGESRGENRFIVTLAGQGYRFVANVRTSTLTPGEPTQDLRAEIPKHLRPSRHYAVIQGSAESQYPARGSPAPDSASSPQKSVSARTQLAADPISNPRPEIQNLKSNRIALMVIGAFGIAAVLALVVWHAKGEFRPPRSHTSPSSGVSAPVFRRRMLAVLPFENLTGNPGQEYFSDGFTEEIITQLARLDPEQVGVIARTSVMRYKHTGENIRQISTELGVDYVVEGSVRRSGNRVRASVQLIRASDQTHVWAQSYEGSFRQILTLQVSVARDVQQQVANRLDRQPASSSVFLPPANPEAYDALLEGLYFFDLRDVADYEKAIDEFRKVIRIDPTYAPAYAGLANCYSLLGLEGRDWKVLGPKAQAAAVKAVALDGSIAATHTALAAVRVLYDWDWAGAQREFKQALAQNPNYALAHHWYAAFYLVPQGRYAEAIAEMKLARQLDPVSPIVNTGLGWAYAISGNYSQAFAQYQEALHLSPRFLPAHFRLAEYYLLRKMYAQAIHEESLDQAYAGDPQAARDTEQEYKAEGLPNLLWSQIKAAQGEATQPAAALILARNYALLGRDEEALQSLATLYRLHSPALIYLKVDPELASLRADPRFRDLERRCGLTP